MATAPARPVESTPPPPPAVAAAAPVVKVPRIVFLTIENGTGAGPWNSAATTLHLRVGQTLRIVNNDSISHTLHTFGAPCPHGTAFAPGETYDCTLDSSYDPDADGLVYDHDAGPDARVWLNVTDPNAAAADQESAG